MAQERSQRINGEITAREVRLIGVNGEPIGVVTIAAALQLAEEADVDLVEIAPQAEPPVCRVMDFGKFRYQEQKRTHEAKLKQKQIQVKEVKFRPMTDDGDYKIKLRNLIKFLAEGDKAKVTLRFRGREMAHQEFGFQLLERVKADLEEHAQVEQFPKLEGRQLVMMLGPKKKELPVKKKPEAKVDGATEVKTEAKAAVKQVTVSGTTPPVATAAAAS